MNVVPSTVGADGLSNTDRVIISRISSEELGITGLYSTDSTHMPGRITIGDISSDGFPDVLLTIKTANDTS